MKVLAEVLIDLDAVEILHTFRVNVLHHVEQNEPNHRQSDHHKQRYHHLDALPAPIPFAERDVREKDECQEEAVDETEDVCKVIDVREQA